MEAVESISKVLNVKGDIVPSTHQVVTLLAKMEDGTIVKGESNIPKARHKITDVFYDVPVSASKEAIHAIEKADVIILGIGSLYTSLCCNLIIKEISQALEKSKAYKIYVSNAMTQSGETENYSMEDHVEALRKHAKFKLDAVLWAKDRIPEDVLVRYQKENAEAVKQSQSKHDYVLFSEKLLNFESGRVRHDPKLIQKFFEKLFRKLAS